jgi:hypothetical protein
LPSLASSPLASSCLLVGVTIDLNVYGFMEAFDEEFTPNHIDSSKRYRFGHQHRMVKWNLERLADALTGTRFVTDGDADRNTWYRNGGDDGGGEGERGGNEDGEERWLDRGVADQKLGLFDARYQQCYTARMRLRLGLRATVGDDDASGGSDGGGGGAAAGERGSGGSDGGGNGGNGGDAVVEGWVAWLQLAGVDYATASRALAEVDIPFDQTGGDEWTRAVENFGHALVMGGRHKLKEHVLQQLEEWLVAWRGRLFEEAINNSVMDDDDDNIYWRNQIRSVVPRYILRTPFLKALTGLVEADAMDIKEGAGGGEMGEETAVGTEEARVWGLSHSVEEDSGVGMREGGEVDEVDRVEGREGNDSGGGEPRGHRRLGHIVVRAVQRVLEQPFMREPWHDWNGDAANEGDDAAVVLRDLHLVAGTTEEELEQVVRRGLSTQSRRGAGGREAHAQATQTSCGGQ